MNSFSSKYPAFAALLMAFALEAKILTDGNAWAVKLTEEAEEISPLSQFIPQANLLGAELAQLKASPEDMVSAAEALVTDLSFTSTKAEAIIAAAFPFAEQAAAMVPASQALIAAFQS